MSNKMFMDHYNKMNIKLYKHVMQYNSGAVSFGILLQYNTYWTATCNTFVYFLALAFCGQKTLFIVNYPLVVQPGSKAHNW